MDSYIEEFLVMLPKASTRKTYQYALKKFFNYFPELTPETFIEESKQNPRSAKIKILKFQNMNETLSANYRRIVLSAVLSFLEHYEIEITIKSKHRVKREMDTKSHMFKNGQLANMFKIASVRNKAILSLATSLGWEMDGFVDLKREFIKKLLEANKTQDFIYFRDTRSKTGVQRLGIINPLAKKWLSKWIQISEDKQFYKNSDKKRIGSLEKISDLFLLTGDSILWNIRKLAKDSNIKTTGRIRFHNIRKWTMTQLSRAGFNEFEVKFCVGKAIAQSDFTYLLTIEDAIREKLPEAYENYLSLDSTVETKKVSELQKQIDNLKKMMLDIVKKERLTEQDIDMLEYDVHEGYKQT